MTCATLFIPPSELSNFTEQKLLVNISDTKSLNNLHHRVYKHSHKGFRGHLYLLVKWSVFYIFDPQWLTHVVKNDNYKPKIFNTSTVYMLSLPVMLSCTETFRDGDWKFGVLFFFYIG